MTVDTDCLDTYLWNPSKSWVYRFLINPGGRKSLGQWLDPSYY
jgi:hypothetical protein